MLSKFFFLREWIRRFPGFLCRRPILYVRNGKVLSVFRCPLSRAHSPGHIPHVDNRTCREHDVTTLSPISISRQHLAWLTRPSSLYCCGYSSCVHLSLPSVIHHLYLSLLLLCVRSTLTVAGNVRSVWIKYQYLNCSSCNVLARTR